MDFDIPPWLQWVSYLAGDEWPQGSESGMFRIQEHLQAAADQLDELIPDLNRVRGETLSVLMGETANAADRQFAMLFDGDYAVDKLSDAVRALGESSGYTGSEIQYSKYSIVVGLALAAAEITYALAMSGPTFGGSLAAIPAIEWATVTTIRQLIALLLRRLAAKVREMLARTTVKQLVKAGLREAPKEAGQELAIAATQEGIVYALQGDRYNVNGQRLLLNGIASTAGGAAGGGSAVPVSAYLGPARTMAGARAKGVTTFLTAGLVGNVAATASVGGDFDPFTVLVSSATSSAGGLKGAGVMPATPSRSNNGQLPAPPADPGSAPEGDGPRIDPNPDESDRSTGRADDNGQPANNGARVVEPADGQSTANGHTQANQAAVQDNSAVSDVPAAADRQSGDTGEDSQSAQPTPQVDDSTSASVPTSDGAGVVDGHYGHDPSSSSPSGLPVADSAPDSSANGQPITGAVADAAPVVDTADTTNSPASEAPSERSTAKPSNVHAALDSDGNATDSVKPAPSVAATPAPPATGAPATGSTSTPEARPTPPPSTPPSPRRRTDVTGEQAPETARPQAAPAAAADGPAPAARIAEDSVAANHQDPQAVQIDPQSTPDSADAPPSRNDCVQRVAAALSQRYGRESRLEELPSPRGTPATALFRAVGSGGEFATLAQLEAQLAGMRPGSSAIVTSVWAGGPNRGAHAYLAVNDNGRLFLEDPTTGERRPWPPQWKQDEVLLSAVGYLDEHGAAVQRLSDISQLVAPAAIGLAAGHPDDGGPASTPEGERAAGERWRDVVPQHMVADSALARRVPPVGSADQLRNPLGLMEAASARARDNAAWWAGLTGAEQSALLHTYPHHIGNAEGIPASARHEANTQSLDKDRRELQARRERGERLTREQRKQLARLERISDQLAQARERADDAGVGGPLLLAFDPLSFGGNGRALVSFGADPYSADSVSWHVPGLKMNVDQLGPCMGDALNHLQSTRHEDPTVTAASIAWIGYDTPSGLLGAASQNAAREGAAILYSDIRAFNAARDAWAGDGSHFRGNHIFAHSYGSTTASHAGRDGRLAHDIRTVTLIGSPGAGPVRSASEFGSDVDVYVAASSRDPVAAVGSRIVGAAGRIFGVNLGVDPAMSSFGAQRITAEFSAAMDRRRSWGTHLSYYKFVDRTADPPVRTESLANFGRIAAGHPDRLDFDSHRTIDDRPLRRPHLRTVEPADGRPLRLDDGEHADDRAVRRPWNPRWRTPPPPAVEPSQADGGELSPPTSDTPAEIAPAELDPGSAREIADEALAQRGLDADALKSPADHNEKVQKAVDLARANGHWWKALSARQQQALIQAYPQQIGNAEGIPPMARHEANSRMLQTHFADRDLLETRRDNGLELTKKQERFVDLINEIEAALRSAESNTRRAQVGGPYLLALDTQAFDGNGRAIVSFGADPYTADSVSWYVPGMTTTIEKLRAMMLRGFNQLQSTLQQNPDLSAASITYIGYKAPGSWDPNVMFQRMASNGGKIFASDLLAFNAGRDVFTGDGSHFRNNHVFAHSYGSTTVSHAGQDGQLAQDMRTVTLIGSPGAGPLHHASEFGIGADNVFVASSSRDRTPGLGGERPGDRGRTVRRMGQGIDPAMDTFGAVRITAEFPVALDHSGPGSRMTHSLYWGYLDPGTLRIRSESLTNFGRISAGQLDQVDREGHRTLVEQQRFLRKPRLVTAEPAIGRPLRIADDPGARHSVDGRHIWNPRFQRLPVHTETLPGEIPSPRELVAADTEQVPATSQLVADTALAERGIVAEEMMSPADHRVAVDAAVQRADANARWWAGLTETQQQALIRAYPHQVGNAEGIPPMARHDANSLMLQKYLAYRDLLMSRRDNGVALNGAHEKFIALMGKIEDGLRAAHKNTTRAQVGGPYLLALDPRAFHGVGRAIVSFGADPYTADSVSWYVPGMSTTIEKLRTMMLRGFNQLQSTLAENPNLSAASITYLGYEPPGSWDVRVTSQRMARQGGEIFASDLRAFNAGRTVFTGDGSQFNGNHIFAHSYGSSTVSHAGAGRRLAGQVQTITLIGSPGAGPLQHASDFGIGADNVFVAASSRDRTTGLGGERPGDRGRFIRAIGQGVDPAMDTFGARRITAEFPELLDRYGAGSRMTHSLYWAYHDPATLRVRSEALANFGRIAAGRVDRVDFESHRTLRELPRVGRRPAEGTVDPAIGRPLRVHDDPGGHYPINLRNIWNPRFGRDSNCAFDVVDQLAARYGRVFQLAVAPSPRGIPAVKLFEALGLRSRFSTYADVEAELLARGDGTSAVLASRWNGRGQAGHAFLAVNDGGKVFLIDPHSGELKRWPPPWSEQAVRRTAVGYLGRDGQPADSYDGSARDLAAAGFIGRVKGLPDHVAVAAADAVLAERGIAGADLRSPLGDAELAVQRARNNATWWAGLSDAQRMSLIASYPHHIGNSEGIPAADRDIANRRVLQEYRDRADEVQRKLDEFVRPGREDRSFLDRVNRIENALRKADADAERAGLDAPLLLALDPAAFHGDGRALISFGADPYTSHDVAWHTGRRPIDRIGSITSPALDQLPSREASAVVWVGDNRATAALHSDIAAFHAVRSALETQGDAPPFTGNHIHTSRSVTTPTADPNPWVPRGDGSRVVAHRGASHELPEQTLAAYREALRQGARGLECDVRLTKDGHLVCIHDKRVDRTSNGTGAVGDMTLAELQQLDFGGWHPSRDAADTRADTGILTLEQLLQLVAEHDQSVTLFIETKHPDSGGWKLEREVVALLERYGMANPETPDQARAAVISFYPDALWRVRRAAPNLPTVLLGPTAPYLATAVGATGIGPSIAMLRANPELVDSAAARGLTTYCWTVNDAADVQYARDLGVGWIATDHPGRTGALIPGTPENGVQPTEPTPTEPSIPTEADVTRAVAEEALAQRVPPVRPDELRNPLGVTEEAVARARNNANWWQALTEDQQRALVETYPQHVGNAEGIPAKDRDAANRQVLQQLRDRADQVQSKVDEGRRPGREERKFLQRVNRLEGALRKAAADAARADLDGPLLLAFDPAEFGGDGRAVVSFGSDPYQADSVSWHAPGVQATVHSLFGFSTTNALNHLQSVRDENPTLMAASIAWIGYDTPSGRGLGTMLRQTAARTGGDVLHSDIRAFNAGRDAWAGDGSHFSGNHVFGYSYGSTTTAYAGRDGRLAGHVSTVSLVGSPGAGPLRHANEFGPGVDVYVASSSQDLVTTLGGRTTGSTAQLLGSVTRAFGLGVDPAMDSFGAVRVAAEFPDGPNRLVTGGTHHAYYLQTQTATARSESAANFGRIAAGHPERLQLERHRTADGRRTVEPAAERAGPRRIWDPVWQPIPNCAVAVADELSTRFDRDIRLDARPLRRGVPARALFEALGLDAQFGTYADVAETLSHRPIGTTAVLVSRWSGAHQGGHAHLAVRVEDGIELVDPHTGERSGWPPHWGQDAVGVTAVGYLTAGGEPMGRVGVDVPLRLDAADAVGRVKGVPDDVDFARRQAEYRAQDPLTRTVDTRYADPLGDVVDNVGDLASAQRLAADMSGVYGPYRIEFEADRFGAEVLLSGKIFNGATEIGNIQRSFNRDAQGNLVAAHTGIEIKVDPQLLRGKGFSKAVTAEFERLYLRSGVDRAELRTHDEGGSAWPPRGFTWDPNPQKLQESLDAVKGSLSRLRDKVSAEGRAVLDEVLPRLTPDNADLPEPIDLLDLATAAEPNLGRRLMNGVGVRRERGLNFVKYYSESPAPSGFKGLLQRWFGIGATGNCAHSVAGELSRMYGREIRVAAPRTRMGVTARALFSAVGTSSEFQTYAQVEETLRDMPPNSSAVLASRWAHYSGRSGGHAYLAVFEGRDVYLWDPETGERRDWPPDWGQDAVTRTAVGYLDEGGEPVRSLHDVPLQLAAADRIGHVQGHGQAIGDPADPQLSYPSPDDLAQSAFGDRIAQLDPSVLSPEAIADAVYRPVPLDGVTGFYEGRVSGFKTDEVIRAQRHVADTLDDAYFVSADIANLRGLNQASADRSEANAHFQALAAIFRTALADTEAEVVPMRVGGDELGAIIVGSVDQSAVEAAMADIRSRASQYARAHNLSDIAHPKYPGKREYNGVGLHIGYAEVLPGLDVRDIFNAADLGVDRSKRRGTDVTGGPGRKVGPDGSGPEAARGPSSGTRARTGAQTAESEGGAARSARTKAVSEGALTDGRYLQPEDVKRATFLAQASQIVDTAMPFETPSADIFRNLFEPLRRDEVSGFYDGRGAAFKVGELVRARQWMRDSGEAGFFLSAQMVNLSGLNQHSQNRAEVANGHYRAITEIFRDGIEGTGATVVPMRTGGDRIDAVMVGAVDSATVDAAIADIERRVDEYTRHAGLANIANPTQADQAGVRLRFGYSEVTAQADVHAVVQSAERRMFGSDLHIPESRQLADGAVASRPAASPVFRAQIADEALNQRSPVAGTTDLVRTTADDDRAATNRARANALWWKGLTEPQRQALIETYPAKIGNAEGIPPLSRHQANMRAFADLLPYRDQLAAQRDSGLRLGWEKSTQLYRIDAIDAALRRGADAAHRGGVQGPYLLHFDAFGLDDAGLAVVSFGTDPYVAESVSWHVPGRGVTLDTLGAAMGSALNHLISTLRVNPTASANSLAWIGYCTTADDAAEAGGRALRSDVLAFNAGRDAWSVDGSRFMNNHLFGHCQGSTVMGYAGHTRLLDQNIRSAVLFGSPGMGPVEHVSEFGPDIDVYVGATSADHFTRYGGAMPGDRGTFLGGMGVDPAMNFFGAQRIASEFPLVEMTRAGDYDIHNFYYKFYDKSTWLRNESLANFGRIAAAYAGRIEREGHRHVDVMPDGTRRVSDPAATRSAHLEDPASARIEPEVNCAYGIAELLSERYRQDVRVDAPVTPAGVPARALFGAVGAAPTFASYTQVADMLAYLGPGSSAVLASQWSGARHGGHAYLAVNDGREIYLMEPSTGRRSDWPPFWGESAVGRTAVGYLRANGDPVNPLRVASQLRVADLVGDVQGIDPRSGGAPNPLSALGLPNYESESLTDVEAGTVYGHGESRLRELNDRLARDGVSLQERARILSEHRNALRSWVRDLMANRVLADVLAANQTDPTFEELVARNEAKGLTADAVYEAIVHTATHSGYVPGTLSDAETTQVYSKFELGLRELNDRLIHDGMPVAHRARLLSELRSSLRAWTRELMSNRAAAEVLASNERNPSFEDLVARYESKGLSGDAVYEAIVGSATHSHYAQGTLSNAETRTVYTTFELQMRDVAQRLEEEGADLEERARTLYELRASLRSWTRTLMADRETAEQLVANEPNPSFEDLVARQQAKGRVGDEIYEAIIASATRSRPSVNASLGIDPENPPPLPPMRGVTRDDGGEESGTHE